MKVTTKDFQILKEENTFEFPIGLTTILGPNGSGKSSLFYAIEDALSNPNGCDDCINFDSKQAEVTIENNNESVTWIRTASSSAYRNNKTGQEYVKASKLDSRDIADLGFYLDPKGRIVNIHNEWSVIFPFGESDTDMFRLFEDIFNISCSFQIIDEMKKDESEVKSNLNNLKKEKEELLNKLEVVNNVKNNIKIEDCDTLINLLQDNLKQISELREDYNNLFQFYPYKNIVLPEVFDITLLYQKHAELNELKSAYNEYIQFYNNKTLTLPSIDNNILNFKDYKELKIDYELYTKESTNLDSLHLELKDILEKQKILQDKLNAIAVCPTCGRPLEE